jgi:hypothetical protein
LQFSVHESIEFVTINLRYHNTIVFNGVSELVRLLPIDICSQIAIVAQIKAELLAAHIANCIWRTHSQCAVALVLLEAIYEERTEAEVLRVAGGLPLVICHKHRNTKAHLPIKNGPIQDHPNAQEFWNIANEHPVTEEIIARTILPGLDYQRHGKYRHWA